MGATSPHHLLLGNQVWRTWPSWWRIENTPPQSPRWRMENMGRRITTGMGTKRTVFVSADEQTAVRVFVPPRGGHVTVLHRRPDVNLAVVLPEKHLLLRRSDHLLLQVVQQTHSQQHSVEAKLTGSEHIARKQTTKDNCSTTSSPHVPHDKHHSVARSAHKTHLSPRRTVTLILLLFFFCASVNHQKPGKQEQHTTR